MKLRRLQGLEREKIESELAELREKIAYFEKVLGDAQLVLDIIVEELTEVRNKFADKRRTEIMSAAKDLDVEDLIAEEDMVVTITNAGYVKRLPVATYRQQKRGGKGVAGVNLKDNDFVEHLFIGSTHDYVLFFSTKGKVYRLKIHELPVGSRHARGTAVVNLLPFEQGEEIAAVINTKTFPEDEYLLFATERGMVKKTNMAAYARVQSNGLIAINLRDRDKLIAVRRVRPDQKVVMVSSSGKAILWNEGEARPMGRDTMGVQGMKIASGDVMLGMEIAPEDSELLVITEKGYGKRTPILEYFKLDDEGNRTLTQSRGGMGMKTIIMTPKKGALSAMKVINPDHELMLISEEGVVIRVKASGISKLGRATQGVKVMNVSDTDRVSAIARVSTAKKKKSKTAAEVVEGEAQPTLLDEVVDDVIESADGLIDATDDIAGDTADTILESVVDNVADEASDEG
jgi:DNA gyrase subunit A